jgi:hypothetical protein
MPSLVARPRDEHRLLEAGFGRLFRSTGSHRQFAVARANVIRAASRAYRSATRSTPSAAPNGVMMIDAAIQRRAASDGVSAEAAMHRACLLRLRPTMMTTIVGALPQLARCASHW